MASVSSICVPLSEMSCISVALRRVPDPLYLLFQRDAKPVADGPFHPARKGADVGRLRPAEVHDEIAVALAHLRVTDAFPFHPRLVDEPASGHPMAGDHLFGARYIGKRVRSLHEILGIQLDVL